MNVPVPIPSQKSIRKCLEKWETLERYTLAEGALSLLFRKLCPDNTDIESVLLKVSALNDFYSTNIYDTYSVSKHILSLNIDGRLDSKDLGLVNEIAAVKLKGKVRNFYSFASKYCSHHKPDDFPIFDSFVEKMLKYYRKTDRFEVFRNEELKDYERFIEIIESLRTFYRVDDFSLRELDIFLWLAGKDSFPNQY